MSIHVQKEKSSLFLIKKIFWQLYPAWANIKHTWKSVSLLTSELSANKNIMYYASTKLGRVQ